MFEYCEYNPFTLTGRPSNHFNQINYAALNKEDGSRKRLISRWGSEGVLLEVDLTGFHLYLIYTICKLDFPKDIYLELSKYYPPYVNPKEYTFKQIYGGVSKDLLNIEPFTSIHKLAYYVYDMFEANELKTFLFEKPVDRTIMEDSSPMKIFNYMLQNLETEFNSLIISDLLTGLRESKTKLILYTYDSFLFDVNLNEKNLIVRLIKKVFKDIPFKLKVGKNYHEMQIVKI